MWEEQELPPEAIVVRGGTMQSRDLDRNAMDHNDEFPGEWAISVWSAPELDLSGLTERAPIRNSQICVCTASALREIGHHPVPSGDFPHADLKLREEPSEALWEELRAVFGAAVENPHRYEGA